MLVRVTFLLTSIAIMSACRAKHPRAGRDAQASSGPHTLPEIAGFLGSAEQAGPNFVRRTYTHAGESIAVTLARLAMTAEQYQDWLRMSRAGFPQAALAVGPDDGNGFYQCEADDPSRCDLLAQLRCGLHIEIRGQGVARRQDADAILAGLALPKLARACLEGGNPVAGPSRSGPARQIFRSKAVGKPR